MREIKFRAWDTKGKYMLDSYYGNWISFDGVPYEEANTKYNTPHIEIEKSKDIILLEYTGLHDKNGKEIYEGDIIKDGRGSYGSMFWSGEYCGFRIDVKNGWKHPLYDGFEMNTVEIIGNIYENPELLK